MCFIVKLYKSTHKKKEKKNNTKTKLSGDSKTVQSVSEYFLDLVFTLLPNLSVAVRIFGNGAGACFIVFHVVMDHSK
jgi:hypothetical protein